MNISRSQPHYDLIFGKLIRILAELGLEMHSPTERLALYREEDGQEGAVIFPLWRFWTYTPIGFLAACLWNTCEKLHIRTPYAPQVFGAIIGKKGKRIR